MAKYLILSLIIIISLFFGISAFAYVMSSSNYRIQSDSLNIGGLRQTSTNYQIEDAIGEIASDTSSSASYKIKAGYQSTWTYPSVAEVPERGGGGFIPPPVPEVVAEPIPEHPEIPKSLIINENEIYTDSLEVTLSLSAKNAFQMAISNTPDFTGISWEPYQTSKEWKLIPGDKEKIVYAKFRSPEGGVSQVVTDTIILDTTLPANILNFEAIAGDKQIILKWKNPPDPDFKAVKIMRSTEFYPSNLWEGIAVYDGKETSSVDTGLTNGITYYYSAFSYDYAGNYSSGAIAAAIPFKVKPPPPEEITTEKECEESGYYWYDDVCHPEPKIVPPPLEIEKLTLKDFDFWQEGKKILLVEKAKIKAKAEKLLTISIDYEKVPEVLKTLMVTLEKDGKTSSFLLRVNKEKTVYQVTMMPPEESGVYSLIFTILDYKNQALKSISGELEVEKIEVRPLQIPWHKKILNWILNWFLRIWQTIKNFITSIFK